MMRLVQIQNGGTRWVALVEEPHLRLLKEFSSVYALAQAAMATRTPLPALVHRYVSDERLAEPTGVCSCRWIILRRSH
jgi:hypothetical protein